MFNQSIKQLKDYELQSIDNLSNKSIAESEACYLQNKCYKKILSKPYSNEEIFTNYCFWTLIIYNLFASLFHIYLKFKFLGNFVLNCRLVLVTACFITFP